MKPRYQTRFVSTIVYPIYQSGISEKLSSQFSVESIALR